MVPPSATYYGTHTLLYPLRVVEASLTREAIPAPAIGTILNALFASLSGGHRFTVVISMIDILVHIHRSGSRPNSLGTVYPSKPVPPVGESVPPVSTVYFS